MQVDIIWDLEDDPIGNVQHILEHGLSVEDVDNAVRAAQGWRISRNSSNCILFGPALDGTLIAVVFEIVEPDWIYPITAYPVE